MHAIPQYVKNIKKPMKRLNAVDGQKWEFLFDTKGCHTPQAHEDLTQDSFTDGLEWEPIHVPGNIAMQGWDIEENRAYETNPYQNEYYYRTQVEIPEDYINKKIFLRFEAVYGGTRVWVNNHFVREHFGSFTTWECDLSDYVKAGERADVVVGIVERFDDPSAGSSYAH
ncbi:MAG: sugar-binding domain-containing protein, partial [Cellulosilyticaceae bacterium]